MARKRNIISVGGASTMASAYSYNITTSNTSNIRAALKGNSNVAIAYMGDSTMRGVDEGSLPYNYQYSRNAMPMKVAEYLNNWGIPSTADNWYGLSGTNLADYLARDSRLTAGGTAAMGSAAIQGGASMSMSSATATMTFTNVTPCDTADIYTLDSASFTGGQLSWSVDGGGATNITQAGNNTIRKTTISLGSVGIHTITISWVSNANALYGIECYNSTKRQIIQRQWGISGGTASDMVNNTGTPTAGRLAQLDAYPPKLVICEMGLVNSWRNSASVSAVSANMQTLITAVKAENCDFFFLTPPYDNGSTGLTSNQDAYVAAMYTLADSNNVGVIDIRKEHLSWRNAVAYGWMRSSDNVHPAAAGYDNEAQIVAQTIMSLSF